MATIHLKRPGSYKSRAGVKVVHDRKGRAVNVRVKRKKIILEEQVSTITFASPGENPTSDNIPAPFSFTDTSGQTLGSTQTSNSITVLDIGSDAHPGFSVFTTDANGTLPGLYRINGGQWQVGNGVASLNDTIEVQHTASASNSTQVNTTLLFPDGNVSDTFTSTTVAATGVADYYVDQLFPSASDSNNGLTESTPWLTIGKAAATMVPGDTVFVRDGVYTETVYLTTTGTAGNPITYQAYPGDRPIIDPSGLPDTSAFYCDGNYASTMNYITIDGFEIRNGGNGIYCKLKFDPSGYEAIGWVIKNCYIHDGNAGSNNGSIYFEGCRSGLISNNILRAQARNSANSAMFFTQDMAGTTIENNDISDSYQGIYIKAGQASNDTAANTITKNKIYDLTGSAFHMVAGGSSSPPYLDNTISNNIVYDVGGSVNARALDIPVPSNGLFIDHNTFDNADITVEGTLDTQITNNAIYWAGGNYALSDDGREAFFNATEFTDIDYNNWYPAMTAIVDRYDGNDSASNFSSWQSLTSEALVSAAAPPDVNGSAVDHKFTDRANNDYTLQGSSPLIGADDSGNNIGAYELGTETIGPDWSLLSLEEGFSANPLVSPWYDGLTYDQDSGRYRYIWESGEFQDNGLGASRATIVNSNEVDLSCTFQVSGLLDEQLHIFHFKTTTGGSFEGPTSGATLYIETDANGEWDIYYRDANGVWAPGSTPSSSIDTYDGALHTIRFYMKMNDNGVANGVAKVWVDGTQIFDISNWEFRTQRGEKFNQFLIAPWTNNGTRAYQRTIWIDNIEIYNTEKTW